MDFSSTRSVSFGRLPRREAPRFGSWSAPAAGILKPNLSKLSHRLGDSFQGAFQGIMQKYTEIFIVAFLLNDIIAIWLPRIFTSLFTGRKSYDPDKDPQAARLPFAEKLKKYVTENIRGLNWKNSSEDAIRELTTGMGVLIIPALGYAIASRMTGKDAIQVAYGPFKSLSGGFIAHLKGLEKHGAVHPEHALKSYMQTLFDEDALKKGLGRELETFSEEWAKLILKDTPTKQAQVERARALENWKQRLEAKVIEFNRSAKRLETNGLHRADYIRIQKFKDGVAQGVKHKQVRCFADDLKNWGDYAKAVFKLNDRFKSQSLSSIAETLYRKVLGRKFVFAAAFTGLAGVYLSQLPRWSQNNESYQATRLIQKTQPGPVANQAVPAGQIGRLA